MNSFNFGEAKFLWFLILVPVFLILFAFLQYKKKKNLLKLGNLEVVRSLSIETVRYKPWLKFLLLILSMTLIIIALSKPQFSTKVKEEQAENVEIFFILDISNSMNAQLPQSQLSRLDYSKAMIIKSLEKTNFKVGLIIFAGQAAMQIPITKDYDAFRLIINSLQSKFITDQGTNIGDAINMALNSFSPVENVKKYIILISDGEDHEGNVEVAIENSKQTGVSVYTLGLGSSRGEPVILDGTPLRDKDGNIVISKLNEALLYQIAVKTGGKYYNLQTNSRAIETIFKEINSKDVKKQRVVKYENKAHYFLFIALILLVIEIFILPRQNRWIASLKIFEKTE